MRFLQALARTLLSGIGLIGIAALLIFGLAHIVSRARQAIERLLEDTFEHERALYGARRVGEGRCLEQPVGDRKLYRAFFTLEKDEPAQVTLLLDDVRDEPTGRSDRRGAQEVRIDERVVRRAPHVRVQRRHHDPEEDHQADLRDLTSPPLDAGARQRPIGLQPRAELLAADLVSQLYQGHRHGSVPPSVARIGEWKALP